MFKIFMHFSAAFGLLVLSGAQVNGEGPFSKQRSSDPGNWRGDVGSPQDFVLQEIQTSQLLKEVPLSVIPNDEHLIHSDVGTTAYRENEQESEQIPKHFLTAQKRLPRFNYATSLEFAGRMNGNPRATEDFKYKEQGKRKWKYDPAFKIMGLGKRTTVFEVPFETNDFVEGQSDNSASAFALFDKILDPKVGHLLWPDDESVNVYNELTAARSRPKRSVLQNTGANTPGKTGQQFDPAIRYMGLGKKSDSEMLFSRPAEKKANRYDPAMRYMGLGKKSDSEMLFSRPAEKKANRYDPAMRYMGLGKKAGKYDPAIRYMGLGKKGAKYDPAIRYMGLGKKNAKYDPAIRYMGLGKKSAKYDPAMQYMGLGKKSGKYDPAIRYMGLGKKSGKYDPAIQYMGLGKKSGKYDPAMRYMGLGKKSGKYDPAMRYMGLGKKSGKYDPAMRYMGLGKKSGKYDPAMRYMGLGKKSLKYDPAIQYMGLGKKSGKYDPAMRYMGLGKKSGKYDPAMRYMGLGKKAGKYDPAMRYMGLGKKSGKYDPAMRYMGLGKKDAMYDPAIRYMGLGKKNTHYDPALQYMGLGKRAGQYDSEVRYMVLGKKGEKFDPALKLMGLGKRDIKYNIATDNLEPDRSEYANENEVRTVAIRPNLNDAYKNSGKRGPKYRPSLKLIGLGKRTAFTDNDNFNPTDSWNKTDKTVADQDSARNRQVIEYDSIAEHSGLGKRAPKYNPYLKHIGLGKRTTVSTIGDVQAEIQSKGNSHDQLQRTTDISFQNKSIGNHNHDSSDLNGTIQLAQQPRRLTKRDVLSSSTHFPNSRYRNEARALSEIPRGDDLRLQIWDIINSICFPRHEPAVQRAPDRGFYYISSFSGAPYPRERADVPLSRGPSGSRSSYDELNNIIKRGKRGVNRPKYNPGWKFIGLGKRYPLSNGNDVSNDKGKFIPCSYFAWMVQSDKYYPGEGKASGIMSSGPPAVLPVTLRADHSSPGDHSLAEYIGSLILKWITALKVGNQPLSPHAGVTAAARLSLPYDADYYDTMTR